MSPGDFDGNLVVDGFDFLKWQRGQSPNPLSSVDLAAWEANYGTGGAPPRERGLFRKRHRPSAFIFDRALPERTAERPPSLAPNASLCTCRGAHAPHKDGLYLRRLGTLCALETRTTHGASNRTERAPAKASPDLRMADHSAASASKEPSLTLYSKSTRRQTRERRKRMLR